MPPSFKIAKPVKILLIIVALLITLVGLAVVGAYF
jgi:hypothetical protein